MDFLFLLFITRGMQQVAFVSLLPLTGDPLHVRGQYLISSADGGVDTHRHIHEDIALTSCSYVNVDAILDVAV